MSQIKETPTSYGQRWLLSLHDRNIDPSEYWMFIKSAETAIGDLLAEVARLTAENAILQKIADERADEIYRMQRLAEGKSGA